MSSLTPISQIFSPYAISHGNTQREKIHNHKLPFFVGMGNDVGILGKAWTFPSDHLPIGITLSHSIHIASWNVLNTIYVKHVIENYQGLNNSTITEENVLLSDDGFTVREHHIINLIQQMISSHTNPRSVIALQECGLTFVKHLKESLPSYIKLIHSAENESDQSIILYNSDVFDCDDIKVKSGIFSDRPKRTVMDILFKEKITQEQLRCVTAHLPWVPNGSGPKELAEYLKEQIHAHETLIVMGDMNRTEVEIDSSFRENCLTNFQQISPYPTFIPFYTDGLYTQSADFDHFFIFGNKVAKANAPDQVLPTLSSMVKLIN